MDDVTSSQLTENILLLFIFLYQSDECIVTHVGIKTVWFLVNQLLFASQLTGLWVV